jgi:hypothetical protein
MCVPQRMLSATLGNPFLLAVFHQENLAIAFCHEPACFCTANGQEYVRVLRTQLVVL